MTFKEELKAWMNGRNQDIRVILAIKDKHCQDNKKLKETIKRICKHEWENAGERLIQELGL